MSRTGLRARRAGQDRLDLPQFFGGRGRREAKDQRRFLPRLPFPLPFDS